MIDLDLKKKIANTLSRYELKCNRLQMQVSTLKNALKALIITPGIKYEKDEHFSNLQAQLETDFDAELIDKKVKRLVHVIDKLEKKKADKQDSTTHFIKQSADTLDRLANKSQDKYAVSKLRKMLLSDEGHDSLMSQLSEALTLCTSSVLKELETLRYTSNLLHPSAEISGKVNQSLQQLLNHLAIPQNLDTKREHIKVQLEQQLNGDNLSNVIDGLTKLVVDAFNIEQKRFKGFLQQLSNQLQDFNVFLKSSSHNRTEALGQSRELESAIQDDINQIKNHMDNSKSIEELSLKLNQNLNAIGNKIKEHRETEQQREQKYQKQVDSLTTKLTESEHNIEEIKNLLNHQKYKINHDSLTNLPNRESYDEYVIEAFQRWQKNNIPFSLAVGDIDHFKRINDTFGHLAGDKVLRKVAAVFKTSIRELDYIARFGGEEFVFIFENTTSTAILPLVEKLRKSVEECQFVYHEHDVDVTVSFGLTTVLAGDDIETLFTRADNALYRAKHEGRNQSVIF